MQNGVPCVNFLKAFPIALKEKGGFAACGNHQRRRAGPEVDPKTMQSKCCPGLAFAGEVLDVDATRASYNLGIAFATAYAAAMHMEERRE